MDILQNLVRVAASHVGSILQQLFLIQNVLECRSSNDLIMENADSFPHQRVLKLTLTTALHVEMGEIQCSTIPIKLFPIVFL
mmetsp:Transcript_9956/g.12937  ORF Transcript_9956/g.12937 Transcript_9956/m.12937 type:complete len:82 (-) Transcript_9956:153-398(-)